MDLVVDRRLELSDDDIDALAARIREVETRADAQGVVQVGRLVIDVLFGGDLDALRSHDPTKSNSLRRVAERLGRVPQRLSVAARVADAYERLPWNLRDRLTAGHLVKGRLTGPRSGRPN